MAKLDDVKGVRRIAHGLRPSPGQRQDKEGIRLEVFPQPSRQAWLLYVRFRHQIVDKPLQAIR